MHQRRLGRIEVAHRFEERGHGGSTPAGRRGSQQPGRAWLCDPKLLQRELLLRVSRHVLDFTLTFPRAVARPVRRVMARPRARLARTEDLGMVVGQLPGGRSSRGEAPRLPAACRVFPPRSIHEHLGATLGTPLRGTTEHCAVAAATTAVAATAPAIGEMGSTQETAALGSIPLRFRR